MQSETQWQQVMARDARQDGRFVFAVRTTGIYCRPSCPSRRPRRDSVEFFPDPRQAERAGYRACLRCKPTEISVAGTGGDASAPVARRSRRRADAGGVEQAGRGESVSPAAAVQASHRAESARVSVGAAHAAGQTRIAQRRRCDYSTLRRGLRLAQPLVREIAASNLA